MSSIDTTTGRSRGKPWAYVGAIVGGAVSVAANVAHSYRPPTGAAAVWSPQPGAVALAAFWPLALLLAVEVMVRVDWPRETRWAVVRFGGVTPVAIVAAIVSYRHLSGLLDWYGEDGVTVALGPLAVDGLMVVSTGALLALASRVALPAHDVADPIGWVEPIEDPIEEPAIQSDGQSDGSPVGSDGSAPDRLDGSDPIGSDGSPVGSGRVVSIHSVADRLADRRDGSAVAAPKVEDLTRAREAIRRGDLTKPVTADAVRDALKIGLVKARAVRDTVNAEPDEDPAQRREQ